MASITDEQIEAVARAICTNLGIHPEERVGHGYGDDMTPGERVERQERATYIPMNMIFSPRWRLYRNQAALAIASAEAVRQVVGEGA